MKHKKAFTLIEMLVVLLLLVLLISIIAPKGSNLFKSIELKINNYKKNIELENKKYKAFINEEEFKDDEIFINKNGILFYEKK